MTFSDWVAKYEKKAEDFEILPGFEVYFEADKGFMVYGIEDGKIIIDHTCCNDIHYFKEKARELGRRNHCSLLWLQTFRNPRAYYRLAHTTDPSWLNLEASGWRPNGKFYWVFEERIE